MLSVEDRAKAILAKEIRVIHSKEFNKPNAWMFILTDLPDKELYNKRLREIHAMDKRDIPPGVIPCYREPLLTKEQEQHLFRKMNYLKYRAKKLIGPMNPKRVGEKRVAKIEKLLAAADRVRNQIAESNFRLQTMVVKNKNVTDPLQADNMLSEAYFNILKAIDYFDYSKGNKFSTYATWVLKRNFSRFYQTEGKYQERYSFSGDGFDDLESYNLGYEEEIRDAHRKKIVKKLLSKVENPRQFEIIEKWFGINHDKMTLQGISKDFGLSKERIRQLKERGLETIRKIIVKNHITYDQLIDISFDENLR